MGFKLAFKGLIELI